MTLFLIGAGPSREVQRKTGVRRGPAEYACRLFTSMAFKEKKVTFSGESDLLIFGVPYRI